MKKILLLIMTLIVSMTTFAQSDIVSVADAIKIFQTKTLYTGQQVLEKQGYIYIKVYQQIAMARIITGLRT